LGNQKRTNYALRADMTRNEFVKEVTNGLTAPPAYFPLNVKMNREGAESFEKVLEKGTHALDPNAFELIANETGALLLDTRDPEKFASAFVPNSINIGIDGSFAPWVGALIPDIKSEILIIADEGREEEVVTRLARVGYDNAIGYLKGSVEAWIAAGKEVDQIQSISAEELAEQVKHDEEIIILDVRKPAEHTAEHLLNSQNMPLDYVNDAMNQLNKNNTYYIQCAGGYRSMIFNSILRARGFEKLIDIKGGFNALKDSGKFAISGYICPSTIK
ncbi:MAG: fold metallo-hydrolase, partial [Daejeonella sp.]|nr:fold metallo-hydrolase [Daejeonella sp.]